MPTKGIAISQIILLVLGILVLAVVAYLLYSNFVNSGTTIGAETCRAAATRACTACSIAQVGNIVNCNAATYLDDVGKNCAQQNKINGNGIVVTPSTTTDSTGKTVTTYSVTSGTIDCAQYTGGNAATGATIAGCSGKKANDPCTTPGGKSGTCDADGGTCQENPTTPPPAGP